MPAVLYSSAEAATALPSAAEAAVRVAAKQAEKQQLQQQLQEVGLAVLAAAPFGLYVSPWIRKEQFHVCVCVVASLGLWYRSKFGFVVSVVDSSGQQQGEVQM